MLPENFIEKKRKEYRALKPVYSSALNEWVTFNSEGLHHLQFKNSKTERSDEEQIYKLSLIRFVASVIKTAKNVESNRKGYCEYWSLVSEIGEHKIRVVLRKRGSKDNLHFWSVMKLKN